MGKVNELHITFGGACVHVNGLVPGVPMRTIFPLVPNILFGQIRLPTPDGPRQVGYYIFPHVATLRDKLLGSQPVPLLGAHLTVVNAKPQPFCHDTSGSFHLSEFKNDVVPNPEVVFEGQAAAYFDIYGGRVWGEGGEHTNRTTHVSILTDGVPQVRIKPLGKTLFPKDDVLTIDSGEIFVTNLDIQSVTDDSPFDFLLNYLVTKGGIPHELNNLTPGLYADIGTITFARLGERIRALGLLIETKGLVSGWRYAAGQGDEPFKNKIATSASASTDAFDLGALSTFATDPAPLDPSCSTGNLP